MNSTWYNVAVVVLWIATMSWLVSQKVLPSLLVGEPPSYRTIVEAQREEPLVGWSMHWNDRPVGWAISLTSKLPSQMTEIRSLVHFDQVPLQEMIPENLWNYFFARGEPDLPMQLEAKSKLVFDPLQRLSQFESSLGFPGAGSAVTVRGTLDGSKLAVSVHAGDFNYQTDVDLPGQALVSDGMSPQGKLPGLRAGQSWNVEIYSPLKPANDPVEILHATVEGVKPISWNGRLVQTWLVVYRSDPGAGASSSREPRGRLWVQSDGTVLQQEVTLLGSRMTFVRLPSEEALALAHAVGDWERLDAIAGPPSRRIK